MWFERVCPMLATKRCPSLPPEWTAVYTYWPQGLLSKTSLKEVMKRKANIPSKARNEVKQDKTSLWHPVTLWLSLTERCVSLGSHSPSRKHSQRFTSTSKAMQMLAWQATWPHQPHRKQKLLGFPASASVQSPCNNAVEIQSQHLFAVTDVLELDLLTQVTHQRGRCSRWPNRVWH